MLTAHKRPRRSIYFICFMLTLSLGCSTVQSREDLLQQAQAIRQSRMPAEAPVLIDSSTPIKTPLSSETIITTSVEVQGSPKPVLNLPFAGERLVYQVKFLGMMIGQMENSFIGHQRYRGKDVLVFESTARTASFFAKVFPIENRLVSYMELDPPRVVYFEESRKEGKYRKEAVVEFDYDKGEAYFYNDVDKSRKTIVIPHQVHDILTANYYARMIPWRVGDTHEFKIYNSEKIYDYIGLIEKQKTINARKYGQRSSFVLQPYAFVDGEKVKKGKITAYFDSGMTRIPLQGLVKTPIFGKAAFFLDEVNNEKFDGQLN